MSSRASQVNSPKEMSQLQLPCPKYEPHRSIHPDDTNTMSPVDSINSLRSSACSMSGLNMLETLQPLSKLGSASSLHSQQSILPTGPLSVKKRSLKGPALLSAHMAVSINSRVLVVGFPLKEGERYYSGAH